MGFESAKEWVLEIEDNSQRKDDMKDPKVIANFVKNGNGGAPYLPEKVYAKIRVLSSFRDEICEDNIRCMNHLHRELKMYFPEYKDAFGNNFGTFMLTLLMKAPMPDEIVKLGREGIKQIWHDAKLRGRGYSRVEKKVASI